MANKKAAKKKSNGHGSRKKPIKSRASASRKAGTRAGAGSSAQERKGFRAMDDTERDMRLAKVARLRFVQHWTVEEIAETLEVSPRTIERDLQAIRRKQRARAKKEVEHVVNDIAADLKLSYDEKMKRLWQEYIRLTTDKNGKPLALGLQKRYQLMSLMRQITETENSHVDQLRKLGIVGPTLDSGDGEDDAVYLIQIKERLKNREKNAQKNTADSSGGGSDGKPSDKAQ